MQRKKPIYTIRKDTCLACDDIKPYGDRIDVSSESKRRETELRLWGVSEKSDAEKLLDGVNK